MRQTTVALCVSVFPYQLALDVGQLQKVNNRVKLPKSQLSGQQTKDESPRNLEGTRELTKRKEIRIPTP